MKVRNHYGNLVEIKLENIKNMICILNYGKQNLILILVKKRI